MKAYSLDLRQKVMAAIERGDGTQRELAAVFDVSRSFIQVAGVAAFGAASEKKVLVAAERDEAERDLFRAVLAVCDPQRLVWIDEMGVHRTMTRAYGRAPRGQRVHEAVPGDKGKTVTVIAAGRLSGIEARMSLEGTMTADVFEGFVEEVLVPTLTAGDIVLFDNLAAHVTSDAEELLAAHGVEVILMPAYSPDLNPIALCWSKIKAHLRSAKARTREALDEALTAAFKSVSLSNWQGWFQHCGYRLSLN
jgi:transposase